MKTVGLITEYNPFHNGHLYHIQQSRELTGADRVIAVMSGNFVQRGAPAILDKYTRAEMALKSGVDLVIELPVMFAVSSAEDFAACGISLLEHLGVVDAVCFGSECGEITPLRNIAAVLADEPEAYREALRAYMKSGLTYPDARNQALWDCRAVGHKESALLSSPNNILGIEYLKALLRQKSGIVPYTVKRSGHGYHDSGLSEEFASATAIRKLMADATDLSPLSSQVPEHVLEKILQGMPIFSDDFSSVLNYALLTCCRSGKPLTGYLDLSQELECRIRNLLLSYGSFSERVAALKTRQYTYSRVSRCLIHLILGITAEDTAFYREREYCGYARVLGMKKESADLLAGIKEHGRIPLITKPAAAGQILDDMAMKQLELDLYAAHVYDSVVSSKYGVPVKNEYTRPFVLG